MAINWGTMGEPQKTVPLKGGDSGDVPEDIVQQGSDGSWGSGNQVFRPDGSSWLRGDNWSNILDIGRGMGFDWNVPDPTVQDEQWGSLIPFAYQKSIQDMNNFRASKDKSSLTSFLSLPAMLAPGFAQAGVFGTGAQNFINSLGAGFGGTSGAGAEGLVSGGSTAGSGMNTQDLLNMLSGGQEGMAMSQAPNFIGAQSGVTGAVTPEMLVSGFAGGQGFDQFSPGGAEDLNITPNQHIERTLGLPSEIPMGANPNAPGFAKQLFQSLLRPNGAGGMLSKLAVTLGIPGMGGGGSRGEGGGGILGSGFGLNDILSVGSGIYGLTQSRKLRKDLEAAAAGADPFAPLRAGYGQKLSALEADPSSITKTPGYDAGLQAVERRMLAQGYQGSGNMMTALHKYGGDFYNNERNFLMQASGGNFNPGQASNLRASAASSPIDLASRSLASIGYGLGGKSSAQALLERLAAGA